MNDSCTDTAPAPICPLFAGQQRQGAGKGEKRYRRTCLIFDLEDAVGPDAKDESRARVCEAISSGGYQHREIVVRVNGLGTDWHDDDLAAVAARPPTECWCRKVEGGEQVRALATVLDTLDAPTSFGCG